MMVNMAFTEAPRAEKSMDSGMIERLSQTRSTFAAQGLLIQLRSHHPTGCLLSELVQVVDGSFIVRAMVQVDGTTIAAAMAADRTVEVAEDRARDRVLEVLGLSPVSLPPINHSNQTSLSQAVSSSVASPLRMADVVTPAVEPIVEPAAIEEAPAPTISKATRSRNKKVAPAIEPEPSVEAMVEASAPEPVAVAVTAPTIEDMPTGEISRGEDDLEMEMEYEFTIEEDEPEAAAIAADPAPIAVIEAPIDLSDAIAQIGAEIDRIGWTKKQGSAYLQETYGKRTRAELSEAELMNFLGYLKSLPSKVQPALSDLPF
jgi:hypothetical protein